MAPTCRFKPRKLKSSAEEICIVFKDLVSKREPWPHGQQYDAAMWIKIDLNSRKDAAIRTRAGEPRRLRDREGLRANTECVYPGAGKEEITLTCSVLKTSKLMPWGSWT